MQCILGLLRFSLKGGAHVRKMDIERKLMTVVNVQKTDTLQVFAEVILEECVRCPLSTTVCLFKVCYYLRRTHYFCAGEVRIIASRRVYSGLVTPRLD